MRFAHCSVQRLAAAFSFFQSKKLTAAAAVVDAGNIFFSSTRAEADDEDIIKETMDAAARTTIPIGNDRSSIPVVADAGLFSAQATSKSRNEPLPYLAPPSQNATDTGILFSSHGAAARTGAGTTDKETVRNANTTSSVVPLRLPGFSSMMLSQQDEPACGTKGFVDCFNGRSVYYYSRTRTWYYDGYVTCKEACGGACCNSNYDPSSPTFQACDRFTGRVCKDGSCSGEYACYLAKIQLVANSCIGSGACCEKYGYEGQVTGSIINSCRGIGACQTIASRFQDGGEVRNVIDSCVGDIACVGLGMFGSVQGNIKNSCNGYGACFALGFNGTIRGNVENSCNNGTYTCAFMANGGSGGEADVVLNSCNAEGACRFAGSVTCLEFGDQYNCIGGYDGGGIFTPMINCCNEEKYACYSTREDNLPQQCRSSTLMVRAAVNFPHFLPCLSDNQEQISTSSPMNHDDAVVVI